LPGRGLRCQGVELFGRCVAPFDPALALPRGLERLVVGLQPDGEWARSRVRRGARPAGGTRATGGPVEPDANDRIPRHVVPRPPVDAGMPLGTARLPRVPIDAKGLQVIALARPSLPAIGPKGRTNHIDLMLGLGGDEEVRIHIPTVEQVDAWEDITSG
jgi:hypothetical protein